MEKLIQNHPLEKIFHQLISEKHLWHLSFEETVRLDLAMSAVRQLGGLAKAAWMHWFFLSFWYFEHMCRCTETSAKLVSWPDWDPRLPRRQPKMQANRHSYMMGWLTFGPQSVLK